jgi:hypothetical protein
LNSGGGWTQEGKTQAANHGPRFEVQQGHRMLVAVREWQGPGGLQVSIQRLRRTLLLPPCEPTESLSESVRLSVGGERVKRSQPSADLIVQFGSRARLRLARQIS